MEGSGGGSKYLPLFETKPFRGRKLFRLYALSVFVGICFIGVYRVMNIQTMLQVGSSKLELWAWIGTFLSELWFALYWISTVVVRWNPIYRRSFNDRLSTRYEKELPAVDIFVCTADPVLEPPLMVVNTVLSVMAYEYPSDKLSVYLSDDGGSKLTFYALLEASRFSKLWLPFCRKFKVEPRSPEAYFRAEPQPDNTSEWQSVKKAYEEMKTRIENIMKRGKVPEDIHDDHKGFYEWELNSSKQDHQTIFQMVIDSRDPMAVDISGEPLPTVVYLAREKRRNYSHHFKAGAMNTLIRVSSRISNAPIILNVDCDMYSNNSMSVRDAMCFFMDEMQSHQIAYVQFPQNMSNLTRNDLYGNALLGVNEVELSGFDGNGGPCYIGTGCFHRRETLCGAKYSEAAKCPRAISELYREMECKSESASILENTCKVLASCTYEENTQWGNEIGLKYGSAVEDILTGLSIQCRGWKSVFFDPEQHAFLGIAPTALLEVLVQHKRWSEGDLQLLLSRHCPFIQGHKRIPLRLQCSYCIYLLWAPSFLATLYFVTIPSLCLLSRVSLFPEICNPWAIPYCYVLITSWGYSLGEFLWAGGTLHGWWNERRMCLFKRSTSYMFGFLAVILEKLGFSKASFAVTAKVADDDVYQRYQKEAMEFGENSSMFLIIAIIAQVNLVSLGVGLLRATRFMDKLSLQTALSGILVTLNLPVYDGLFFRMDRGRIPSRVTCQSLIVTVSACSLALFQNI
ncbi:unnamed protein product [Rhodiola kirilowii]